MTKYSIQPNKAIVSQSLSAEQHRSNLQMPSYSTREVFDISKLGTLCNNIFRSMKDMGYNDALKIREELRLPMLRGKILSSTYRFYPMSLLDLIKMRRIGHRLAK